MRKEEDIPETVKDLVIAKIDAQMPAHLKLSIGSYGSLTKEEMIDHVKKGDEIGRQIINVHMSFMKDLLNGDVAKAMASVENE